MIYAVCWLIASQVAFAENIDVISEESLIGSKKIQAQNTLTGVATLEDIFSALTEERSYALLSFGAGFGYSKIIKLDNNSRKEISGRSYNFDAALMFGDSSCLMTMGWWVAGGASIMSYNGENISLPYCEAGLTLFIFNFGAGRTWVKNSELDIAAYPHLYFGFQLFPFIFAGEKNSTALTAGFYTRSGFTSDAKDNNEFGVNIRISFF